MMCLRLDGTPRHKSIEDAALQTYKTVAILHEVDLAVADPVAQCRGTDAEVLGSLNGGQQLIGPHDVLSFERDAEQPEGQRSCAFVRRNAAHHGDQGGHFARGLAFCLFTALQSAADDLGRVAMSDALNFVRQSLSVSQLFRTFHGVSLDTRIVRSVRDQDTWR
jgi:hypothetical protein